MPDARQPMDLRLSALPRFGAGIGLHRMSDFAATLPVPWFTHLDAIKVTGSKGKGSVSAMCAAILHALGIRAGLFTSPHLWRFNERIQVAGEPVADPDLERDGAAVLAWKAAYEQIHPGDIPGAFEIFTALALRHFAEANVDTAVAEAGIGGRYDSTRIIPGGVIALTSVELEHTELLGRTVELIAYDKADLCPCGGVLIPGRLDPSLVPRLRAYCRLRAVAVVDPPAVTAIAYEPGVMRFSLAGFRDLTLALPGEHQARNAAVAITAVVHWLARNRPGTSRDAFEAAVREGLAAVRWPGRLERIARNPEIVVDVGHTPESLRCVAETVPRLYPGTPVLLVTGVSSDKEMTGILRSLLPVAGEVIATRAHHKGSPVAAVAAACEQLRPGIVWRSAGTIEEAVDLARKRAAETGAVVLIAGGLFLAVEAWTHLQGRGPRDLHFF